MVTDGGALEHAADDLLADRAADGDTRAFAVIVRRYGRLLRAYATRVAGSSAHSDDIVQDALVVAWQQLPTLEDRTALRSWLLRITTRKALDTVKAQRPQEDIDDHEPAAPAALTPDGRLAATSLGSALARALDALPEPQGRVWLLRELGGYRYDEIAEELGLPVSTVRGQLARARVALMQDLEGWR